MAEQVLVDAAAAELQATVDEWNFLTPMYLEHLAEPIGQHIPHVLNLLEDCSPKTVLDVGCGNGDLSNAIKRKFPLADVCGVDICEAMITHASAHKADPGMEFIQSAFPQIPESMKGARYDLIVCSFTLMYMKNKEEAVISRGVTCAGVLGLGA
jgi:2-polyprenyl-3-methyl-5-hydroxy-6-metoxy-1,4-benzoquinol methylase